MMRVPRSISICCGLPVEASDNGFRCTACGRELFRPDEEEINQMKITEIRIDRTKSLGNYENLKLGFTAVVEDGESAREAVDRIKRLLDWEINLEEREDLYKKKQAQLATTRGVLAAGNANGQAEALGQQVAQLEAWISRFETVKAEFETDTTL